MQISIRRAGVDDASIISRIGKTAFKNAFECQFQSKEELSIYLERTYDPLKLSRSMRKENNIYLLALYNGEAIGFTKLKKHSLNAQIESIAQVELQKIYVLPEYQGLGAGGLLLGEVKTLCRDIYRDYIWLDTHVQNEKAIRLYEKHGFRKVGKYFFTIGTQVFEYHLMSLAVAFKVSNAC